MIVDSLLNLDAGSSFTVNGRMHCKLNKKFSDWKKDINSPSKFAEAEVDVIEDDKSFDGLLIVQEDILLAHKHYMSLCLKKKTAEKWQSMFTVVDISI